MIPTGLNGIRKLSTFSLNSLLQCCKKKRRMELFWAYGTIPKAQAG